MEESWKYIEGYEGLYKVSNKGRVKSLNYNKTKKEKILKPDINSNGYLLVKLCKDKTIKRFLVHRLVANAFLPNPNNLPCVNHKDENCENNNVENLEWCTHKYNINYGTCIKRSSKARSKQVYQYTKEGELISVWKSTNECGRNGYGQGNVAACCRNCFNREGNNVYKGYIWSYTPLNNKSS